MNLKQLRDIASRHAVLLEQLKAGEIKGLERYYRQLDKIIREPLTRQELTELTPKRYQQFLKTAQQKIEALLQEVADKVTDIALYESEFEHKNLTNNLEENFKTLTKGLLGALSTIPL